MQSQPNQPEPTKRTNEELFAQAEAFAASIPILRRRAVPWPKRRAAFFEPDAGGKVADFRLSDLLMHCLGTDTRVLYLMGGHAAANTPPRDWWLEPAGDGWQIADLTSWPHGAKYSIANELQSRPCRVDVHMSASWFDDPEVTGAEARDGYVALDDALHQYFDRGASIMGTPARTGLDLFQRSLPREGFYAVMPEFMRDILYANVGQGRAHAVYPDGTTADHMYWLDARWMYAACMRNLPTGSPVYHADWVNSRSQHVDPYAPAFYCVSFRVPSNWAYPFGLLPVRTGDEDGPATVWPHKPGSAWVGWCTGAELLVAREAGWRCTIHEGITFSGGLTFSGEQPDPARPFIERMRAMRQQTTNKQVYAAARNITIGAVGAFNRQARAAWRSIPFDAPVPEGAYKVSLDGDRIDYRVDVPLHPDLLPFQHPEWSGMIWGRSRARLNVAALRYMREVPSGRILLFRNDALVVDTDPGWTDDGTIGTFRMKRQLHAYGAPLDVPTGEDTYRKLLRQIATLGHGGEMEETMEETGEPDASQ